MLNHGHGAAHPRSTMAVPSHLRCVVESNPGARATCGSHHLLVLPITSLSSLSPGRPRTPRARFPRRDPGHEVGVLGSARQVLWWERGHSSGPVGIRGRHHETFRRVASRSNAFDHSRSITRWGTIFSRSHRETVAAETPISAATTSRVIPIFSRCVLSFSVVMLVSYAKKLRPVKGNFYPKNGGRQRRSKAFSPVLGLWGRGWGDARRLAPLQPQRGVGAGEASLSGLKPVDNSL